MLRFTATLILTAFTLLLHAQIYNPVKWTTSSKQLNDNEFELQWKATIEDGWYVYSQFIDDGGPEKTTLNYDQPGAVKFLGKSRESGSLVKGFDDIWEMDISKFKKQYTITQRIQLLDDSKPVKGYLTFQTCDDTKCLPPADFDFSFNLKKTTSEAPEKSTATKSTEVPEVAKEAVEVTTPPPATTAPVPSYDGIYQPVTWSAAYQPAGEGKYKLTLKANIDKGWHIYSKDLKGDGPIPLTILADAPAGTKINGAITETAAGKFKEFDQFFEMEVIKIKDEAIYIFEVEAPAGTNPSGIIDYMSCDAEKCIPLNAFWRIDTEGQMAQVSNAPFSDDQEAPMASTGEQIYPINNINLDAPVSQCSVSQESQAQGSGMWNIFFLGFIGGLIALLTPCVFPMIPLTVSFFTKGSKNKRKGIQNAFLYGLSIFLIYVILSVPFHLLDSVNPNILNDISTNVWLNLAFFAIFIFFAFSFFGYYEISLPSSLSNKVASAEGVGGVLGIFFMALTLALVSFSCTGPILGSLLAGSLSSDGGAWELTSGMAGFGLALALPFALFAAFPGWMNTLPKSGGWLNTVKVVLGFIELGLAFKFLSNADLVKHWGLLKIEPFLIIWLLIALALALYLFGFIRFPGDSKGVKPGPIRIGLGVVSLLFTIYLGTGFRYNDATGTFHTLPLLSGLAPPVGYSIFYPKDCPQNLNCFHDLEEGLAYATAQNKPVFLDFTGYACVNCRKMEEHVWPKEQVYSLLSNEYVVISLYVDDKTLLPEDEQVEVVSKSGGVRKLRTIGNKWNHFQTEQFNNNSQPYYALITADGTLLNTPVGYTPESAEYADFLQCGLDAFKNLDNRELIGTR